MKVITIGLDRSLFEKNSDTRDRISQYGPMVREIHIIVFSPKGFKKDKIGDNIWLYPTNSSSKFFYITDAIKVGRKLMREKKIDLITGQDPFLSGLSAYVLAGKKRAKLLIGVYGTNIYDKYWLKESFKHRIFKIIGHYIFKRADAIQPDGLEASEELRKHYGDKVFWKPMIPSNIEEFKVEKRFNKDKFKVLFIGRLVKQKNLPALLNIIKAIIKDKKKGEIEFTIIGQGPFEDYFKDEIIKRELSDFIKMIPRVERAEIVSYFKDADIFILSSIYEGFPRVFMEAAAIGLPMVVTRVSGIGNLIKNKENSFVIEQGDEAGFVDAVNRLYSDSALLKQMSEKLKKNFWENYNFDITLNKQREIYNYLKKL
ncbi:hypothetical protein DRH27_01975 [Candidatus Falkowbacteria bacterium]|nr:MAG: hypothetical protein DRH27_01975 [Candidatus Falkowbacteria bacterium]